MSGTSTPGLRTDTGWQSAWCCRPGGFAVVAPVSGVSVVAAVGVTAGGVGTNAEKVHNRMRCVLEDLAMVVGYDPVALLERANAVLSAAGLGRLDGVALLSRPDELMPASVAGRGDPAPLVVAPDHLTAPVRSSLVLDRGWAVVLGAADAPGVPHTLLTPGEVSEALALLNRPSHNGTTTSRTLLAIVAR
jgi:hypothetical protein